MDPNLILSGAATYRPKPFLFLTTDREEELTSGKIAECLRDLAKAGFGGFVLFNKPPTGFSEREFLSDRWFAVVRRFARQSRALGLEMWINEDLDCPVGNAGGRIQEYAPHLKARHVVPDAENGYRVLQAEWGFPGFEEKESAALFREIVYETYKKHVGEYFGDPIIGFFSDADNRRVDFTVMFDENSPMRDYFPWSSDFEDTFFAEYSYRIEPFMPDIFARKNIPQAVHYWEHAGRLYSAWFGANAAWLHENGLLYTGHTSDTSPYLYRETERSSCFTEGRFSDIEKQFDYPGTDHELCSLDSARSMLNNGLWYTPDAVWGEAPPEKMPRFTDLSRDLRAKQAASTAFMYGKKRVMCEMFAATNFGVSPEVLMHIAAYQIMQGVNFIVPHAWHYRFGGELKYFAPPDFSPAGTLYRAMPRINEKLTELCELSAKSRPVCDIALLDPTESVWRNDFDSEEYFTAFSALNRAPYGLAVCDENNLIEKDLGVRVVVAAGLNLPSGRRMALEQKGYIVITGKELDRLPTFLRECPVSYAGEGTLHFMRRRFDDGTEICFIANIECESPIRGVLTAFGRREEILLYPGEIGYAVPGEMRIRKPDLGGAIPVRVPKETDVFFSAPNVIPLERLLDGDTPAPKTSAAARLDFMFVCKESIPRLGLYVPVCEEVGIKTVRLNGTLLTADELPSRAPFTEDLCRCYDLKELTPGEYVLSIEKAGAFQPHAQLLLRGDFDVELQTDGSKFALARAQYNIRLYIPEKASVSLSARRKTLRTDRSAALQGQPFYSGKIVYSFSLDTVPGRNYRLTAPVVRDTLKCLVDGEEVGGTLVLPPYEISFTAKNKKTEIRLEAETSAANTLECYAETSGVIDPGTEENV
ncbi:MAG: hypothetical protein IJL26_07990 [Clostridia bacterium]|nr:hypothetical protein [Clostridia bacterium]